MFSTHRLFIGLASAALIAACATGSNSFGDGSGNEDDGNELSGATTTSGGTSQTTTTSTTSSTTATTSSSVGGMGGAGGSMETTTSGAGGAPTTTTSTATATASSSTGGMQMCIHDVCTEGDKLTLGCDMCVDTVCAQDSYCCDTLWDSICVSEAVQFCNAMCQPPPVNIQPGDLVITEIMNNPSKVADVNGEWFEVYNDSANPIDLNGLVIRHQAPSVDPNATHVITKSVILMPGDFAVLGINANASTNGSVTVDYEYTSDINLSNTKDHVAIETPDNPPVVIDVTTWNQSSGLDPNGKTRSLNPQFMSALDNDTDKYFCEASSPIAMGMDLGTPGKPNDPCP